MEHELENKNFESLNNEASRGAGFEESQVELMHILSVKKGKVESNEKDTRDKI